VANDVTERRVRIARLSAMVEQIQLAQGHLRRAEQCFSDACLVEDPDKISMRWAAMDTMHTQTSATREATVLVLAGLRSELDRARAEVKNDLGTEPTGEE